MRSATHGVPSTQTVFSDDFESGLSKWKLQGNPGWAATTYRADGGSSSAYCAGSSISPPGPYANNMNSWMIAGPFDLSAATAATLSLSVYSLTEMEKDYVNAYVSLDNDKYYGTGWSGNWTPWTDKTVDLTNVYTLGNVCGKSQVWIAIVFESNPSVVYEGSYVDNVALTATVPSAGPRPAGLVLTADAETVGYNGSADLVGALLDATSGSLVPGKSVGLFWSQENKIDGEWNFAGSADSSTGDYSVTASGIKRLTYFALFFDGDSEYLSTMSNLVRVNARAKITPPAVPSVVSAGPKITSWGSIQPPHTAAQNRSSHTKIYLERYYGGKWRSVVSPVRAEVQEHQDRDPVRHRPALPARLLARHGRPSGRRPRQDGVGVEDVHRALSPRRDASGARVRSATPERRREHDHQRHQLESSGEHVEREHELGGRRHPQEVVHGPHIAEARADAAHGGGHGGEGRREVRPR